MARNPPRGSGVERAMRRWWVAWLVVSATCASAPLRDPDLARLAQADALVRAGCYDCLLDARETYAALAVGRARPLVVQRLFETALLTVLREKEIALDWSDSLALARTLLPEVDVALEPGRLLALVDALPPDSTGWPRRALTEFRRTRTGVAGTLDDELAWLASSGFTEPVRQYVAVAAECSYPFRRRGEGRVRLSYGREPRAPDGAPPLVVYRTAICDTPDRARLEGLLDADSRFVEATYFLGRLAVAVVQRRGNVAEVRDLVDAAYARFPSSPAVTFVAGRFNQFIGDCRAALTYYDETLALQPLHENGLLGRTICLTFLSETEAAIASATRLIDLDVTPDVRSDGFYWRAWNRHHRADLPAARADIESAKALRSNPQIHTLAGVIEHDQDELDPAEEDLRQALQMSGPTPDCTAHWYLSLVLIKREQWPETATAFEHAMRCYDRRAREAEEGLAAMQANTDVDPAFKARQIAGFEAAIAEDRAQYHAAAFNAANHHARAGRPDLARPLLDVAARDPKLADLVAELREIIKVR
jgi:tetratricopeptide (TPR) repeat protein